MSKKKSGLLATLENASNEEIKFLIEEIATSNITYTPSFQGIIIKKLPDWDNEKLDSLRTLLSELGFVEVILGVHNLCIKKVNLHIILIVVFMHIIYLLCY